MTAKITNIPADWRVRLSEGEYELSLRELGEWIEAGRVSLTDHVRPPSTKRWKLARECN